MGVRETSWLFFRKANENVSFRWQRSGFGKIAGFQGEVEAAGREKPMVDSRLFLREQQFRGATILDIAHLDRVQLDPFSNDIVYE